MKRNLTILLLLLMTVATVTAQRHLDARWEDGRTLTIAYSLTPQRPASDYAYTVTPLLCSAEGDTLQLSSVTWRGKRNVKKLERSLYFQGVKGALPPYHEADDTTTQVITTSLSLAAHPWLTQGPLHLCFLNDTEGCCQVEQHQVEGAPFIYLPPFAPQLSHVADRTGIEENLRTEAMGLYIYFPINSARLDRNFRNNGATLDSILALAQRALTQTSSKMKQIEIVGQASPDGPQKRNLWLAEHRALALKNYAEQQLPQAKGLFTTVNGGEGWAQLRQQIAESDMPERDSLLAIIDTEADLDLREQRIKRYNDGRSYDYLRKHILADQRNSGYMHIRYTYLPDEEAPVINRAIALIGEGKAAEALTLLQRVSHDERSHSALGTAHYLVGNTGEAVNILTRAARQGNADAAANLKQIQERERRKQLVKE